jgi:hypothetical protein
MWTAATTEQRSAARGGVVARLRRAQPRAETRTPPARSPRLSLIERCRGARFAQRDRGGNSKPGKAETPPASSVAPTPPRLPARAFWYGWRPWRPLVPWWLPEDGYPPVDTPYDWEQLWHLAPTRPRRGLLHLEQSFDNPEAQDLCRAQAEPDVSRLAAPESVRQQRRARQKLTKGTPERSGLHFRAPTLRDLPVPQCRGPPAAESEHSRPDSPRHLKPPGRAQRSEAE